MKASRFTLKVLEILLLTLLATNAPHVQERVTVQLCFAALVEVQTWLERRGESNARF